MSAVRSAPRVAAAIGATLGEGPLWVAREGALWFTDIKGRQVHRFDPASDALRSWTVPEQVGFVVPAAAGGFVLGLRGGLHHFDPATGGTRLLVPVEPDRPDNRINDGVVDAAGRLWFGTMDDREAGGSGRFYRLEADGSLYDAGGPAPITNGPALSPDGRTLYQVDTLARTVTACTLDADGRVIARAPFVTIEPAAGNPDGPAVDAEGCVWIALYGGWEARRYSPAGELLEEVRFPVSNITKLAFGGADLRTAFATTARHLLGDAERVAQPQAGHLFAFEVAVPGLPATELSVGI